MHAYICACEDVLVYACLDIPLCVCVFACKHVCNCAFKLVQRVSVWFEAKETRHHELRFHSSLYASIYLSPWGR